MTDEFVEICPADEACPWDETQLEDDVVLTLDGRSITLTGATAHVASAHPEMISVDWRKDGLYKRELWARYKRADE